MKKDEIITTLNSIFQEVFEDKNLVINGSSNSYNISGWDSLQHIYLIVSIEEKFDIKFTADQIQSWDNVGDMTEFIFKNV